jgi:general stress protein 26
VHRSERYSACRSVDTFRRRDAKVKRSEKKPKISRHRFNERHASCPLRPADNDRAQHTEQTMADKAVAKNTDDAVSTEKKLDDLYDLIEGIEIAMLTTRRADGQLVSRPMQTQERENGIDLWFMTNVETSKLDDLMTDAHVNLGYFKGGEWVSVSGIATVSTDRDLVRELYKADWKAWLGDEGGDRDGSENDPRIALILVEALSATYMKVTKPKPVVLFEVAKAMVTGSPPNVGKIRNVTDRELHQDAGREPRA